MKCLLVVQDEGWASLCSLTSETQNMNQIAGTGVYISLLPAFTFILFSSRIYRTASILDSLDTRDLHKTSPLIPKHTR
jgi:hypothetical protein